MPTGQRIIPQQGLNIAIWRTKMSPFWWQRGSQPVQVVYFARKTSAEKSTKALQSGCLFSWMQRTVADVYFVSQDSYFRKN